MRKNKPSTFVRRSKYIPGVGKVLIMSDARRVVVNPTPTYKNCSKLIDAIFKIKTGKNHERNFDYTPHRERNAS